MNPVSENANLRNVLEFFAFTLLKFFPQINFLKIGNHLKVTENTLIYMFLFNHSLDTIDLTNDLNICLTEKSEFVFSLVIITRASGVVWKWKDIYSILFLFLFSSSSSSSNFSILYAHRLIVTSKKILKFWILQMFIMWTHALSSAFVRFLAI